MIRTAGVARLQFVAASGLLSGAIERWGVSTPEFSHVDIVLPNGGLLGARDETIVVDSWTYAPGVQIRPPNYARWLRRQVVRFDGDSSRIDHAYQWAIDMIGHKYDEDAILGIIFGQRWHKNGDFICSAFGTEFAHRCGWVKNVFQPWQQTSPNTLYAMTGAAGGIKISGEV